MQIVSGNLHFFYKFGTENGTSAPFPSYPNKKRLEGQIFLSLRGKIFLQLEK